MSEQVIWEVATIKDEKQLEIALSAGWEPFAAYPFINTLIKGMNRIETVFVLRRRVPQLPKGTFKPGQSYVPPGEES